MYKRKKLGNGIEVVMEKIPISDLYPLDYGLDQVLFTRPKAKMDYHISSNICCLRVQKSVQLRI